MLLRKLDYKPLDDGDLLADEILKFKTWIARDSNSKANWNIKTQNYFITKIKLHEQHFFIALYYSFARKLMLKREF